MISNDFEKLAERIKSKAQGRKIVYIANPGNFGDGLIRYATKRFFSDYKIKHEEMTIGLTRPWYHLLPYLIKSKIDSSKYLFIYGGGGSWCEAYDFGFRICKFINKFSSNLIVLPSTYEINAEEIRGTLYRRDQFESKKNCNASVFCHDMAFYLTTKDNLSFQKAEKQLGLLFRTDAETRLGVNEELPCGNIDISTQGDYLSNGDEFLREVSTYQEIHTDRLHVAIAGLILKRKVNLYTGSYFKIKRIYQSSIADNFPNVNLLDDTVKLADVIKDGVGDI